MQCFFVSKMSKKNILWSYSHSDILLGRVSCGTVLRGGAVVVCSWWRCRRHLLCVCLVWYLSGRWLAGWLLDNKVTCLAAQISFVCDAIFLATISPNFASWCQSANGRSIRKLYRFSCFSPTFLSRSQLISSESNRSLCRICNTNHLSTSIPVPKFPGCALYSIDLLFLLALD